ncbi:PCI domain-containing protein [Cryptosporidium andersoni]|uniref:PCI domain-containing protein n=1 Tax=Cryptosporidium andersoni TaxID=117008 RepID=A0A1J4MDF4_9CRYT|nr:PCI domain-containing protein [Cryptosporidium andersoni]
MMTEGVHLTNLDSLVKDPKCVEDLRDLVNENIDKYSKQINSENFSQILEIMLQIEKRCRQAFDGDSLCILAEKIIIWSEKYGSLDTSLEYLQLLCKKRGQLKKVISHIIHIYMKWLIDCEDIEIEWFESNNHGELNIFARSNEHSPLISTEDCIKVITALNEITKGKIYLELEAARLMIILSRIKESQNKVKEASNILEDITIETIGNMKIKEKYQYILEQMRLALLCKDFVRLQIFAKKINTKVLDNYNDLKLIYHQYLIYLWLYEQEPYEIAQCYANLLDSLITSPSSDNLDIFSSIPNHIKIFSYPKLDISLCIEGFIFYMVLVPCSEIKDNELARFKKKYIKYIQQKIPYCEYFIDDYLNKEVLFFENTKFFTYPIPSYFEQHIKKSDIFVRDSNIEYIRMDCLDNRNMLVPKMYYQNHKRCKINLCIASDRLKLFLHRIQQRNLCIFSRYYRTITFERIQELINIDEIDLQIEINDLIERKLFSAKINQPERYIHFNYSDNSNSTFVFNKYHSNIKDILNKLDLVNDLISSDQMIHQFRIKRDTTHA